MLDVWDRRGSRGLAVTIRAARVSDHTLYIYSGAGIVADSDAYEEWQELNTKSLAFKQCIPD